MDPNGGSFSAASDASAPFWGKNDGRRKVNNHISTVSDGSTASLNGVSYDSRQNSFFDQRGVRYETPLAEALAAHTYADRPAQTTTRTPSPTASSFAPRQQLLPGGGAAFPHVHSNSWVPATSETQQRTFQAQSYPSRPGFGQYQNYASFTPLNQRSSFPDAQARWLASRGRVNHVHGGAAAHAGALPVYANETADAGTLPAGLDGQRVPGDYMVRYNLRSRPTTDSSGSALARAQDADQGVTLLSQLTLDDPLKQPRKSRNPGRRDKPNTPRPAPKPTSSYFEQSSQQPRALFRAKPLLLVVDLNGTLLFRPHRSSPTHFVPRPGAEEFISWLMNSDGTQQHQHRVMVWSSAKPENVAIMVRRLFTKQQQAELVAVWARDKLGLTPAEYSSKVQVYKELRKVWTDSDIMRSHSAGGTWDQSNTILVDDSTLKASSEPYNILLVDEYQGRADQQNDGTLKKASQYLDVVARYKDVSSYMKLHPFRGFGA